MGEPRVHPQDRAPDAAGGRAADGGSLSQLETTAYYAFGGPLYVAVVAAESWIARRRGQRILTFAPTFGNLSAGLGSIVVGLFLGPALVLLYDTAFRNAALVRWADGSWVPWVLAIVLTDLGHYLHHRLDHRVAACWAVHGVHHQPEEMNFTVAMRHAWFSDLYSFPFYAMLPLVGVPTSHFFVATTLLSFHALLTHSVQYDFPSFGFLVTPRSHSLHHARNPRYIDKNFGAMFCVWDKLFGTHVALDANDPPEWGTTRGYATHCGARAQWVGWQELLERTRGMSLPDRLRVFFGRPNSPKRADAPPTHTSVATRIWVVTQFLAIVVFSHWVFILREEHSWSVTLVSAAVLLAGMVSLGALLDGRRNAWRWEGVRLVATLAVLAL